MAGNITLSNFTKLITDGYKQLTGTDFGENKRGMDVVSVSNTVISSDNSTNTSLNNSEVFTGEWELRMSPELMIAFVSDQDMTVAVQFSVDAVNVDSTITYNYTAGSIEPPHRLVIARQYFRVVVTNNSGSNQTYLRVQSSLGQFGPLTSPLNASVLKNADSLVVRNISLEDELFLGRYENFSLINKFGANLDVDSGTLPEDVWNGGGVYTGFPTGAAEEFQIILSSASDVGGTVTFRYLASTEATEWTEVSILTTGTTTNTGITGIRSSTAYFDFAGPVNVGTVTMRHVTTTANVFWIIPIGKGQTRVAIDTIPTGNVAAIKKIVVTMLRSNTANVSGSLWVRELGKSPRLLRPFSITQNENSVDGIYGGLKINGFTDIAVRIEESSASNVTVFSNFDYILAKA